METIIIQKLKKEVESEFMLAKIYYAVLSDINNLQLTEREIQLVAFAAIKGNISNGNVRGEFIEKYNTSSATINNIISKLKRLGIFIKEQGKVKVNPQIIMDFKKDVILQITLSHGKV